MFPLFAMDAPLGPAGADNTSVLLWSVIILAGVVAGGWAYLASMIKENRENCEQEARKCAEEREQYRDTSSGHHKALVAVYQQIIEDKEESSKTKNQLLFETTRVLGETNKVLDRVAGILNKGSP